MRRHKLTQHYSCNSIVADDIHIYRLSTSHSNHIDADTAVHSTNRLFVNRLFDMCLQSSFPAEFITLGLIKNSMACLMDYSRLAISIHLYQTLKFHHSRNSESNYNVIRV
ncbi:hypothetical protein MT418_001941 [Batrachochytrium dendrobatidis]